MKKYRLLVLLPLLISGLVSCNKTTPTTIPSESHEDTSVISSSIDINKTFTTIKEINEVHQAVKVDLNARVIATGKYRAVIYDGTGCLTLYLNLGHSVNNGDKYHFVGETITTSYQIFDIANNKVTMNAYSGNIPEFDYTPWETTNLDEYNNEVGKVVSIKGLIAYKNGNYYDTDLLKNNYSYHISLSPSISEHLLVLENTDKQHKLMVDVIGVLFNVDEATFGNGSARLDMITLEAVKHTTLSPTSLEVTDELSPYYNINDIYNKKNYLTVKATYENEMSVILPVDQYSYQIKTKEGEVIDKNNKFPASGKYDVVISYKSLSESIEIDVNDGELYADIKEPYELAAYNSWSDRAKTGDFNEYIALRAYGNGNSTGRYSATNNTWSISQVGTKAEPVGKLEISIKDTYKNQYVIKGIKIDYFPDEDKPGQFEYNENALLPSTFLTLDDVSTMDLIVVSTHELVSNAVCRITKMTIIYGVNS